MPRKRPLIAPRPASVAPSKSLETPIGGEQDAARVLGVSVAYVRKDRRTTKTIPCFRIGRLVRYDIAAVVEAARAGRLSGK